MIRSTITSALTGTGTVWLLQLLDCPEVQRLRRIHQLGVSYLTYHGADHNRLAHSLGVVHLMQQALQHLEKREENEQIRRARALLIAAALLHDVGHGPFSHLFEPCLGIDHEVWSREIILSEETEVNKILKRELEPGFPQSVADLIDPSNHEQPPWQKSLLSSQLDMDRVDYLHRDSLFTGAGYGHFDWYRLLNSFEIYDDGNSGRDLVWSAKSLLSIEEYILSRYYMFQNVYLHKTTCGFEAMLVAMWAKARKLSQNGEDVDLLPAIKAFWDAKKPTVKQYLAIEEFTVLLQIQNWTSHPDKSLSDLARRFLDRKGFGMVEPPDFGDAVAPSYFKKWENKLRTIVKKKSEYAQLDLYCLKYKMKAKYSQPYVPEKEKDQQTAVNSIRILTEDEHEPVEVSERLPRLRPLTERASDQYRYYVPKDVQAEAKKLRKEWK